MATKLWLHQQHPSPLVSALGQISEVARRKRKCTGTVRHERVPRDFPEDSLGFAKKDAGCSQAGRHGADHALPHLRETSVQAATHRTDPRRAAGGGFPAGQKVQDAGQCHGTHRAWRDRTLRIPISFRRNTHSVALVGIGLKGTECKLFRISIDPWPGEYPSPSAWFCQPDPVGLALVKPQPNSVQSFM